MHHHDTICAISTPPGIGGIAIVRLAGPEAKSMAERVLVRPDGDRTTPCCLADHRARLAHLYDGDDFLDEVVATWFAAPRSYSGDDVVEIACHGSVYVQQRVLSLFCALGVRLAEPGEFTLRAFLNGRLDLSQAEAVADLIDSRSQTAHQLAVSQLRGGYAQQLEQLRQQLIDTTALLELELDFSEEDLQFAKRDQLLAQVNALREHVQRLMSSFQMGNALKRGVPVAIVGRPNVGKSTLLNALLHDDRAIVSPIAGTTRDTVEELFTLDGILFRLIDTAGLHHSSDTIEQAGIERSHRAMQQASIILFMSDDDTSPELDDVDLTGKTLLLLRNKIDLEEGRSSVSSNRDFLPISAQRGDNLDELRRRLVETVRQGLEGEDVLLTNVRHYEALQHVDAALGEVLRDMEAGVGPDLVSVDLRDALYHLGTITGKVTSDEVLGSIFSRFCIGK